MSLQTHLSWTSLWRNTLGVNEIERRSLRDRSPSALIMDQGLSRTI
jgi:hypothetical protein